MNSQAGFCDLDNFCSCLIWFVVFTLWRFVLNSGSRMMTQWIWFIIDWFWLVCVFMPDPYYRPRSNLFLLDLCRFFPIVFIDPLNVSLSAMKGLFIISALKNVNDRNWIFISKLNILCLISKLVWDSCQLRLEIIGIDSKVWTKLECACHSKSIIHQLTLIFR